MKYQNKENGIVGTVVEESEKYRTITLQFEDGNQRPYSISTIKRHWKLIQEESQEEVKTEDDKYVEEVMQQKKDLGIECPPIKEVQIVEESNLVPMPGIEKLAELKEDYCADGTSYAEVGKEIAKQAKQKAQAVKKEKAVKKSCDKVTLEARDKELRIFLEGLGYDIELKSGRMLKAKKEDSKILNIYVGLKKCVLMFTKTNAPKDKKADRIADCPFSHRFDIYYDNLEALKEFM